MDATGGKVIYEDVKGYEDAWRKHHTSSVTRDVWVHDLATGAYRQLSRFAGEDRNPVFDADRDGFYYLSEQSGSFNVYRSSLSDPATASRSRIWPKPGALPDAGQTGVLCFSFRGEI